MRYSEGIAPSTGYSSAAKFDYRRAVWRDLSRFVRPNTWAVMMPARGCEEIEVALELGVPIENIFCFDASAAVIATSQWRKKYPEIAFAATSLSDLNERIARTGRKVSAVNLDMCGTVAGDTADEIEAFLAGVNLTRRAGLAVNISKGREGKTLLRALERIGGSRHLTCDRMRALFAIMNLGRFRRSYRVSSQGGYRENKTPMTWATFDVAERLHGHERDGYLAAIRDALASGDRARHKRFVDLEWMAQVLFSLHSVNVNADLLNRHFADEMARKAGLNWGSS